MSGEASDIWPPFESKDMSDIDITEDTMDSNFVVLNPPTTGNGAGLQTVDGYFGLLPALCATLTRSQELAVPCPVDIKDEQQQQQQQEEILIEENTFQAVPQEEPTQSVSMTDLHSNLDQNNSMGLEIPDIFAMAMRQFVDQEQIFSDQTSVCSDMTGASKVPLRKRKRSQECKDGQVFDSRAHSSSSAGCSSDEEYTEDSTDLSTGGVDEMQTDRVTHFQVPNSLRFEPSLIASPAEEPPKKKVKLIACAVPIELTEEPHILPAHTVQPIEVPPKSAETTKANQVAKPEKRGGRNSTLNAATARKADSPKTHDVGANHLVPIIKPAPGNPNLQREHRLTDRTMLAIAQNMTYVRQMINCHAFTLPKACRYMQKRYPGMSPKFDVNWMGKARKTRFFPNGHPDCHSEQYVIDNWKKARQERPESREKYPPEVAASVRAYLLLVPRSNGSFTKSLRQMEDELTARLGRRVTHSFVYRVMGKMIEAGELDD